MLKLQQSLHYFIIALNFIPLASMFNFTLNDDTCDFNEKDISRLLLFTFLTLFFAVFQIEIKTQESNGENFEFFKIMICFYSVLF